MVTFSMLVLNRIHLNNYLRQTKSFESKTKYNQRDHRVSDKHKRSFLLSLSLSVSVYWACSHCDSNNARNQLNGNNGNNGNKLF